MKGFNYSLQSVLEYRKDIEENAKHEFAKKCEKYTTEENKLINLKEQLKNTQSQLIKKNNIIHLKNTYYYINMLENKLENQENIVKDAESKLNDSRLKLVHAQKDVKTMEKLKEKELKSFTLEINRKNQIFMDEVAMSSFLRK